MERVPDRSREFRQVCGRFATGVTVVVTETEPGQIHGMTANAFMSVSLDPLLIAVAVHGRGRMAQMLTRPRGEFTLTVLSSAQQHVAETFAASDRAPDPRQWLRVASGSPPVLKDAQAWMRCMVESVSQAGDHLLVLGRAVDFHADIAKLPLIFYGGRFWEHLERQGDWAQDWLLLER